MSKKNRDYLKGTKINRWTFLRPGRCENRGTYYYQTWFCKCDCGIEKEVFLQNILKGKSISCGCYNKEQVSKVKSVWRKAPGESCRNHLILVYKRGALKRKLEYELTVEQFSMLTKQNCFYCGVEPLQITGRGKYCNINEDYIYNGIDRINNNIGYILDNCISCCKNCNYAKRSMKQKEFINWISKIYNNLKQKDLIHG